MRARYAVPMALLILLGGWWTAQDPTRLGPVWDVLEEHIGVVVDDAELVQLQPNERWLVIVIDFPTAPVGPTRNIERANTILTGVSGGDDYISQLSGEQSSLTVDVLPDVYHASKNVQHWGADADGERDIGETGSDGPAGLAADVLRNSLEGVDLSPYDLNGDNWVDRVLLLHTANAQEDSGGSGTIWSHFGALPVPVVVGDMRFGHYTIASFDSGLGTIMHEMLHQMGGIDLYDVHGSGTGEDWNGVGDWDIMASGNWNGDGRTPALPSLASLDLIGADRITEVVMGTYEQSYILRPLSNRGTGLEIALAPDERLLMSYRADSGFDSKLPGAGLLVTIQDESVGAIDQNLVNTDPQMPWLYVLEADGDGGLLNGDDQGVEGDLFREGDKFGAEGRPVIDHRGRKVSWTAEVVSMSDQQLVVNFSASGSPGFDVLPPHQPLQLLPGEGIPVIWSLTGSSSCSPTLSLVSTDGRQVTFDGSGDTLSSDNPSADYEINWQGQGAAGTAGRLVGNATCTPGGAAIQLDIPWYVIGALLQMEEFEYDIPVKELSTVSIPLTFKGGGSGDFDVRIEGPLSRIATAPAGTQVLSDGSEIELSIDPKGLLMPGMVAKGEVVLRDADGLEQSFTVTLIAEGFEGGGELVWLLSEPSNLIMIAAAMLAFSILLNITKAGKGGKKKPKRGWGRSRKGKRDTGDFSIVSALRGPPDEGAAGVSGGEVLATTGVTTIEDAGSMDLPNPSARSGPKRPGDPLTETQRFSDPNAIRDLDDER